MPCEGNNPDGTTLMVLPEGLNMNKTRKNSSLKSRLIDFEGLPSSALISINEIVFLSNRSRTSIWRDVKSQRLPKPTAIGPQARRGCVSDVRAYLNGGVK